jgi:hypothetical protein
MLAPPFGEHVLLFRFQKRELPDLGKIARQTAFALKGGKAPTAHVTDLVLTV